MEKIKSILINLEIAEFKNAKTGEVNTMTKISYTYPREKTDTSVGPNILTCYRPGNIISKVSVYVGREVNLEIDERYDQQKNVWKKTIKKIENIEV